MIKINLLKGKQTTACMNWEYKDKHGYYEYDFNGFYPPESAYFMWEEGNFSCDCNRSIFFGLPEMDCGEKIEIKRFWLKFT